MEDGTDGVYFVYDGECPLCKMGATSFRIRQSVGVLHLINKREVENSHPLIQEINAQQLDLDKGMIIKFGSRLYQGGGCPASHGDDRQSLRQVKRGLRHIIPLAPHSGNLLSFPAGNTEYAVALERGRENTEP